MIPVSVKIYVHRKPVDMRRGFDRLALLAREATGQDARSGALFIFANRAADKLKILWWDRNGYCVLYKRLHRARFLVPVPAEGGALSVQIEGRQLAALLAGQAKEARTRKRHGLRLIR